MSANTGWRVKWAGPNTALLISKQDGQRIYMTKKELIKLKAELNEFTDYYPEDFGPDRIDITDEDDNL